MTPEPLPPRSSDSAGDMSADIGVGRRAAVVIVSTTAAAGDAEDTVGPQLVAWLRGYGYQCPEPVVVADGPAVAEELTRQLVTLPQEQRPRFLITSGGTGISPDDATPEATAPLVEKQAPGIMHALWSVGRQQVEEAVISRGVAGVRGRSFVVNLPGSPGGARDGMTVLAPLLPHLQAQLEGVRDHDDAHRHPGDSVCGAPGVVGTQLGEGPMDPTAAEAAVTTPQTGATVSFRGVIRTHDSGRDDVTGLTYTAHPDAADILAETVVAVAAEHPQTRIWCGHRLGALSIGDEALLVTVAAAHRAEAFACCAAVVDAVKAEVPIWKQQHYASGGHDWVGL